MFVKENSDNLKEIQVVTNLKGSKRIVQLTDIFNLTSLQRSNATELSPLTVKQIKAYKQIYLRFLLPPHFRVMSPDPGLMSPKLGKGSIYTNCRTFWCLWLHLHIYFKSCYKFLTLRYCNNLTINVQMKSYLWMKRTLGWQLYTTQKKKRKSWKLSSI